MHAAEVLAHAKETGVFPYHALSVDDNFGSAGERRSLRALGLKAVVIGPDPADGGPALIACVPNMVTAEAIASALRLVTAL
jgi:hypothetical protein